MLNNICAIDDIRCLNYDLTVWISPTPQNRSKVNILIYKLFIIGRRLVRLCQAA